MNTIQQAFADQRTELASLITSVKEFMMRTSRDEQLDKLERRIQKIENNDVETVQWRIEHIDEVRAKTPKGAYLASPEFSACGLNGFSFHFYPSGDDFAHEGFCSLYFHVPDETRVSRTLFLGRVRHGPVEAESLKCCGVSDMCVLQKEIDRVTGSIVVGVDGLQVLRAPKAGGASTWRLE